MQPRNGKLPVWCHGTLLDADLALAQSIHLPFWALPFLDGCVRRLGVRGGARYLEPGTGLLPM